MRRFELISVVAIVLVACGGGDGSTTSAPPPPPLPPPSPPPTFPSPIAEYSVHDLPRLPGDTHAQALDVNDMGQIVGISVGPNGQTSVLWSVDETGAAIVRDLGKLPGGSFSFARGINNRGQIVGFADDVSGVQRPVIWTADGGIRDLGVPVGLAAGQAHSINDGGQVVGAVFFEQVFFDLDEQGRFAIWTVDEAGNVVDDRDLGTLGGKAATARDNNIQGHVAGTIWFAEEEFFRRVQTAFFWSEQDGVIEIRGSQGFGINDNDEVGGTGPIDLSPGIQQTPGYLWSKAHGLMVIEDGEPFDINNSGRLPTSTPSP